MISCTDVLCQIYSEFIFQKQLTLNVLLIFYTVLL
jgi:hypothetical protein